MKLILTTVCIFWVLTSCGDRGGSAADENVAVSAVANPSDYVGEYTRGDGTPFYIVERDSSLVAVVTGNVFVLKPVDTDRFELDLVDASEPVSFERDAEGRVVATSDSQGSYPRKTAEVPAEITSLFGDHNLPAYSYTPPSGAEPGLPVGDASKNGLPPTVIEDLVNDIYSDPDYRHAHALLVQKNGELVLEEYFAGFDQEQPHNLRSATKSVISALVGAAVLQGHVRLDDKPLAVIGEAEGRTISEHKAALTLADMMDMRHGLRCDDWDSESPGNERNIYGEPDWTTFILSIPDAEEEADASYCSAMPLMVGRYLEIATGQPLPQFADQALFSPLGFERSDWQWDFDLEAKEGPHGGQVHLRPRDMLRFGELYSRGGLSEADDRLLPEGWVATTFDATMPLGDWRRYNDFWWAYEVERDGGSPVTVHMASGIAGQKIALVPALDMIVVMTGGSFSEGRSGPTKIIERLIQATVA